MNKEKQIKKEEIYSISGESIINIVSMLSNLPYNQGQLIEQIIGNLLNGVNVLENKNNK